MQAEQLASRADLHGRLRWLGVAFFAVAAVLFVGGVGAVVTGKSGGGIIPWCLLSMGVSLGTFGTNDDTTLHLLTELARKEALPTRHRGEFDAERKVRGARLSTLHDHPKAAFIMPAVAILAIAYAAFRVGTAWGLLS